MGWELANLGVIFFHLLKDASICSILESIRRDGLLGLLVRISVGKPLRTKIPSIAKWFMNTLKRISTGHKDLLSVAISYDQYSRRSCNWSIYPLKSCRASPRMSRYEDWFPRHRIIVREDSLWDGKCLFCRSLCSKSYAIATFSTGTSKRAS